MAKFETFKELKTAPEVEHLHINRKNGKIESTIKAVKFKDKDTNQFIIYIPSFEISGYGSTSAKALESFKFSLDEFFKYIISLSPKNLSVELFRLGWKHNKIKKKDFSRAYVDVSGNLKGFNIAEERAEVVEIKIK